MMETTDVDSDISISDSLSKAWGLLNKYMSVWVNIGLLIVVPSIVIIALLSIFFDFDANLVTKPSIDPETNIPGGAVLAIILVGLYQTVLSVILIPVYIKVAGGKKLKDAIQTLKLGTDRFVKVLVATLVVSVIIAVGIIFLVVPGVIAAFLLALTVYVVADTGTSLGDAMSKSVEYAKKYFVQIFLLGLTFFGIAIVLNIVSNIFLFLPSIGQAFVSTALFTGLQIFAGLTGAALYLEMKKRSKINNKHSVK